jgi:hypothetical protein
MNVTCPRWGVFEDPVPTECREDRLEALEDAAQDDVSGRDLRDRSQSCSSQPQTSTPQTRRNASTTATSTIRAAIRVIRRWCGSRSGADETWGADAVICGSSGRGLAHR